VTRGEREREREREREERDRARKGAHDSTAPRATLARPTVTASADFEHCDCSSPHREQAEDEIPMSPPPTKAYPEQAKGEANGARAAAAYLRINTMISAELSQLWMPLIQEQMNICCLRTQGVRLYGSTAIITSQKVTITHSKTCITALTRIIKGTAIMITWKQFSFAHLQDK